MAYTPTTTFSEGTAMDSGLVQDELDDIRTAINGGVAPADFTAKSLRAEHLRRPVLRGYPAYDYEGIWVRQASQRVRGETPEWRWRRRRVDIFPGLTLDEDSRQVVDGRSIRARAGRVLECFAYWGFRTVYDYAFGGGSGLAPGAYGGDLSLYVRDRATGTVSQLTGSKRFLIPNYTNAAGAYTGHYGGHHAFGHHVVVSTGWHDVMLIYDGTNADTDVTQIEIGQRGMLVTEKVRQAAQ